MESANVDKPAAITVTGELVLQTGRHAGTRQPLGFPTTFIGREQGCDIRLNVDGIDPLHCLLITGQDGVRLRDLNSAHGTFVNGVRTEHLLLQNGDVLGIGPFQFRVDITALPHGTDPMRDALRVQTAAVAAQQAALEEEEIRLAKRKADLEHQEEQLAAHLAAKQRQAEEWSEQAIAEREALRLEKLAHESRVTAVDEELTRSKNQLASDHQKLAAERQRINTVFHRLRKRWKERWAVEREKYQKQAAQFEAERSHLTQKESSCHDRESALNSEILRFHAEREYCTRQMLGERAELRKDQENWRKRRSLELLVLTSRQQELDDLQAKFSHARQLLIQEKEAWDCQQDALQQELYGLNNRVVNQRIRLEEQTVELTRLNEQRLAQLQALTGAPIPEATLLECDVEVLPDNAAPPHDDSRIATLAQLASDLADQRTALAEQYERLAQINQAWHDERLRAAEDLDAFAERIVADEQDLAGRRRQTQAGEESLRQRQAEIESVRQEIAIDHAQLQAREEAIKAEHAANLDALRRKEALLNEQLVNLTQIRNRWNSRRQEEISHLQSRFASMAHEQSEVSALHAELFTRRQELIECERGLAEKSLAAEQYWQETSSQGQGAEALTRLDELRRAWFTINTALVNDAKNERAAAKKSLERLDALRVQLQDQTSRLMNHGATLAEKHSMLDELEATLHAKQIHLDDELRMLEHLKKEPERQHILLRAEADAVAQVVFGENDEAKIDKAA